MSFVLFPGWVVFIECVGFWGGRPAAVRAVRAVRVQGGVVRMRQYTTGASEWRRFVRGVVGVFGVFRALAMFTVVGVNADIDATLCF